MPGIGLLILSTSNIIIALNDEIRELNLDLDRFETIIKRKIGQLKKLNLVLIGLYVAAFVLVLGGVLEGVFKGEQTIHILVFSGYYS